MDFLCNLATFLCKPHPLPVQSEYRYRYKYWLCCTHLVTPYAQIANKVILKGHHKLPIKKKMMIIDLIN